MDYDDSVKNLAGENLQTVPTASTSDAQGGFSGTDEMDMNEPAGPPRQMEGQHENRRPSTLSLDNGRPSVFRGPGSLDAMDNPPTFFDSEKEKGKKILGTAGFDGDLFEHLGPDGMRSIEDMDEDELAELEDFGVSDKQQARIERMKQMKAALAKSGKERCPAPGDMDDDADLGGDKRTERTEQTSECSSLDSEEREMFEQQLIKEELVKTAVTVVDGKATIRRRFLDNPDELEKAVASNFKPKSRTPCYMEGRHEMEPPAEDEDDDEDVNLINSLIEADGKLHDTASSFILKEGQHSVYFEEPIKEYERADFNEPKPQRNRVTLFVRDSDNANDTEGTLIADSKDPARASTHGAGYGHPNENGLGAPLVKEQEVADLKNADAMNATDSVPIGASRRTITERGGDNGNTTPTKPKARGTLFVPGQNLQGGADASPDMPKRSSRSEQPVGIGGNINGGPGAARGIGDDDSNMPGMLPTPKYSGAATNNMAPHGGPMPLGSSIGGNMDGSPVSGQAQAGGGAPFPTSGADQNGLRVGVRVMLHGLVGAAQFNDTFGEIVRWDEEHSRWKVRCELDGSTKAIK